MLFLDLRGHGKSEKPYYSDFYIFYKLENFVEDLKNVAREAGFKHFVLVGHSLGSMISIKYANMYPDDVNALILIGGATGIDFSLRMRYPITNSLR